jgi:ABC-type branched-subunit amino acid transport system substrate-binding protein
MLKKFIAKYLVIILLVLSFSSLVSSEDGITSSKIILGQSAAFEGPARELGLGMKAGMNAYFEKINSQGGIKGRKIRLISLDDGYEPDQAAKNTSILIEKEKVFLLIGEVGTPTSKVVAPIAEKAKVPFFAPFTGAELLRDPPRKYVINMRASYYQETEKLTEYLADKLKKKRIACFYQDDSYGKAGLAGMEKALGKRGMKLISTGTYKRNTTDVRKGLLAIADSKPEAVVMIGAYKPCAEFVRFASRAGLDKTIMCNISFVGTKAFVNEAGTAGEGVIISQVMPFPWGADYNILSEYQRDMKTYHLKLVNKYYTDLQANQNNPPAIEIGYTSLEGYLAAKLFCEIANSVTGEMTREKFLKAVNDRKKFSVGGIEMEFGENDRQGMDQVFLTIIKNGKVVPVK